MNTRNKSMIRFGYRYKTDLKIAKTLRADRIRKRKCPSNFYVFSLGKGSFRKCLKTTGLRHGCNYPCSVTEFVDFVGVSVVYLSLISKYRIAYRV